MAYSESVCYTFNDIRGNMFLDSSKDILFLVLAFSILWFTAFLCWALYYVISILRDASRLIEDVREKLDAIDNAIQGVRDKLTKGASSLSVMASGAKLLMEIMGAQKAKVVKKAKKAASTAKKKARKVKKKLEADDEEEF